MSFQISIVKNSQNKDAVFVNCGMSTEICFTKMIAAKKNLVYYGWNVGATIAYPNIVEDTLDYISSQVLSLDWTGCNGALFNPGFCSVPYICATANLVYFPSQILVGFNRFEDLCTAVKVANAKGIKCYAVAGYDGCIPNCIVAWIKFIGMPPQYKNVMKIIGISKSLTLCVYDKDNKTTGENCARLLFRDNLNLNQIQANDIYLLYVNEGYGQPQGFDTEIFKKLITDIPHEDLESIGKAQRLPYISDWESGMDTLAQLDETHTVFTVKDSLILYQLATAISFAFLQQNNIKIKGLVLNPYFISDPCYELNYGYIPLLYWQHNPANEQIISQLLAKFQDKFEALSEIKLYYNVFSKQKLINFNKFTLPSASKFTVEKIVENSCPLCFESGDWVTSFKPETYNFSYLSFQSLVESIHQFSTSLSSN